MTWTTTVTYNAEDQAEIDSSWATFLGNDNLATLEAEIVIDKSQHMNRFNTVGIYLPMVNVSSQSYLHSTVSEKRPYAPSISAVTASYSGELGYCGTAAAEC